MGLLVNTQGRRLHEPLDKDVAFVFFKFRVKEPSLFIAVPQ